jgi:hypothetical protein
MKEESGQSCSLEQKVAKKPPTRHRANPGGASNLGKVQGLMEGWEMWRSECDPAAYRGRGEERWYQFIVS